VRAAAEARTSEHLGLKLATFSTVNVHEMGNFLENLWEIQRGKYDTR
jgi:hypothetical protein